MSAQSVDSQIDHDLYPLNRIMYTHITGRLYTMFLQALGSDLSAANCKHVSLHACNHQQPCSYLVRSTHLTLWCEPGSRSNPQHCSAMASRLCSVGRQIFVTAGSRAMMNKRRKGQQHQFTDKVCSRAASRPLLFLCVHAMMDKGHAGQLSARVVVGGADQGGGCGHEGGCPRSCGSMEEG